MAMYVSMKEKEETAYRRIEAMTRNDYSIEDIVRASGLPRMNVIDVMQNIFARDMKRR